MSFLRTQSYQGYWSQNAQEAQIYAIYQNEPLKQCDVSLREITVAKLEVE